MIDVSEVGEALLFAMTLNNPESNDQLEQFTGRDCDILGMACIHRSSPLQRLSIFRIPLFHRRRLQGPKLTSNIQQACISGKAKRYLTKVGV